MRIGLDFDNTIVCYDKAIALLADELFELPKEVPRTKVALRDHLRSMGREPEWTAFQGELYGPGMRYAEPFEGAIAAMHELLSAGHELIIISHRSRQPYAGPAYDLHAAARGWVADRLQRVGLFKEGDASTLVNFLETREAKLAKIAELSCEVFVDDLPEVLTETGFPKSVLTILFDPALSSDQAKDLRRIRSWSMLPRLLAIQP